MSKLSFAIEAIRFGKPVKQSTVRRMLVKGKPVYVRDVFVAPIGKPQ